MRTLLTVFLILFLFGCGRRTTQHTPKGIPHSTVYVTPAGDKIIFLEDYYRVYFKAMKADYANRNKIYDKDVADTIFNEYFTKSEYSQLVISRLATAIKDTTKLGAYISEIVSNREKMEGLITTALSESRRYLKNDSVTIYIIPSNFDIEMVMDGIGGVMGLTAGSKQIMLTINPEISKWKEMLQDAVAREFEQAYWTKMNFNKSHPFTLLDYLVFEGRADSYAHLIYPDIIRPTDQVLPPKVEVELWNRIKSELKNTDIAYQYEIMFGHKDEYPLWGGYTLGYHIVQSALKNHPELTPVEWANLPSEKILEMSDYK